MCLLRYNIVQKGSIFDKYTWSFFIYLSKWNVTQNPKLECGVVYIRVYIYQKAKSKYFL